LHENPGRFLQKTGYFLSFTLIPVYFFGHSEKVAAKVTKKA
jgi:hypothetical protein